MSDQDLAAVLSELRDLRAEVSTLRAQVAASPTNARGVSSSDTQDGEVGSDGVSRRQALRTAGVLAAGALTGGAALLASASPAAALPASAGTYVFTADSSNPAVEAQSATAFPAVKATASSTHAITASASGNGHHGVDASASGGVSAYGVWGRATTDSTNVGVRGTAVAGKGVQGDSTSGLGVFGQSDSSAGVSGQSTSGSGVEGYSGSGNGMSGSSTSSIGVYGYSVNAAGVSGISNSSNGGDFFGVVGLRAYGAMSGGLGGTGVRAIGDRASVQIDPQGAAPPTRSDQYYTGDLHVDSAGALWFCVTGGIGAGAKWRQLAGTTTAGSFHPLAPGRSYDSRKSAYPVYGTLASGDNRTISLADSHDTAAGALVTTNFVPVGATAVFANITVVSTVGRAYLTVNPGGTTTTAASTINWSADGQVLANGVALTLNSNREVTVVAGGSGGSTHFIIDVTGYWL